MTSTVVVMIIDLGMNNTQFRSAIDKAQQRAKKFSTETQRYLKKPKPVFINNFQLVC
ncbi:hypothetical protein [Testudinibacter sp. TR-2022]|uniref:hypothetical protein n=1 Tax=Testudinibacter sp. TR-2022 TaxID=2585029 RepID=UPI00159BCCC9|nr:hypothetical protein [Testudinibacter sp. TR-2022]